MRFIKTARHKSFEYQPLYYDKDKVTGDEPDGEFSIRDAYAREKRKTSPLAGFYGGTDMKLESRKNSKYRKMVILLIMLAEIYLVFGWDFSAFGLNTSFYIDAVGVVAIFITLVFFIREVNKY